MRSLSHVRNFVASHGAGLYAAFVVLLLAKVLWGYWSRDMTYGDTSSYFRLASTWVRSKEVNIVWSPLYTAYYGSWLGAVDDVVAATLMHRVALIFASVALVAWIGYVTLPRVLAILLTSWWTVLPIHYDTLYEVHLFGALPLILLLGLGLQLPTRWRFPVWMMVALGTVLLIRNEYVVVLSVLCAVVGWRLLKGQELAEHGNSVSLVARYGVCLALPVLLTIGMYQQSFIKGEVIHQVSEPKHTLNMCQVYAFGHQQRHPEWTSSPWTECQGLMQETFMKPMPSLGQMVKSNPLAVAEHFAWNLGLLPAGLELLLFNAISSEHNPDYAAAKRVPIYPAWALGLLAVWLILATWITVHRCPPEGAGTRSMLSSQIPLFFGTGLMVLAVVMTQRPRPSYLLGFGVLLVWAAFMLAAALMPRLRRLDVTIWPLVLTLVIIIAAPAYASLQLPSKSGMLGDLYTLSQPHRKDLCNSGGGLAVGEYSYELSNYLCSPLRDIPREGDVRLLSTGSLTQAEYASPSAFVQAMDVRDVRALVIDPPLLQRNVGLDGCEKLGNALLENGWTLLAYSARDGHKCIASYAKIHS